MNAREYYEHALAERGYKPDEAQLRAVDRLQKYYDDWMRFKALRSSALKRLLNRPDVPRGVYLWGGVGRGKSFLMDAFYATVPVERKTRLHFHEFMRGVHRELENVKGMQDPLDEVARRVAKRYRLICFDEFHVSDVADAMILYRLLLKLFEYGTSFVMTSNYEPSTLYPEGLHRDRILPAIELIKSRMDILNVDSGIDYRRRSLEQVQSFHYPLDQAASDALEQAFQQLADTAPQEPVLHIEHREIRAKALSGSVVWFDFATLCGGPRSQNDYLELANRFHAVILSGVPRMGPRQASEARRFTWLIDVFYDHKVKLIISAECAPEALYTEGALANEFHRTVSRILEMQSREYLESERRQIGTL
ncbi:cell division protein ZapE [Bordetella avium]|uniref:ATPase n=1 Tax=Bordetella avium (strain 197N) TaxID=360910 RepID=Q2L2C7_BORA1|nr:cell division protein ZapE [Bordetella avium]AZY52075.1 cell division protein ZapE [Bordetella avium]RIQ14002.1 cell division protein ZapE [Bordetella avium]RIQ16923.1 cell division protein ZapE [Bordetella avium]RIQ36351.1 cell division protein ZapE [Bordetella avium]RIQ39701.1 cell division protein ZapE [Bordetella avium]